MHPKQICDDFASVGSALVLDNNDLYIENPENVYPELEEFAKTYKKRIIQFLQGGYSKRDHSVKQTIDKIVDWFLGVEQEMNSKISDWLLQDYESLDKVMMLLNEFYKNGWTDFSEPVVNYENEITDKLSNEIFERAMSYFKGA